MNQFVLALLTAGLTLSGTSAFCDALQIGSLTVEVVEGDITAQQADGIIVPHFRDNISLLGAGLSVSRKGGNDALESAKQILRETNINFGQAFLTSTAFLRAKIINVVTIGIEAEREAMIVEVAVANSLAIAGGSEMKTVAVDALGVGNGGTLTARESARAILSAAETYSGLDGKVERLRIAIEKNPEIYQTFVTVLNEAKLKMKPNDEKCPPLLHKKNDPEGRQH